MFLVENGKVIFLAEKTLSKIREYIGLPENKKIDFEYCKVEGWIYSNGFHKFNIIESLPHGSFKLRVKGIAEADSKYQTVSRSKDLDYLKRSVIAYKYNSIQEAEKDWL